METRGSAILLIVGSLALVFAALAGYFYLQSQKINSLPIIPSPVSVTPNVSCNQDSDCSLQIKDSWSACNIDQGCQPLNYSENKWMGINNNWYQQTRNTNCPPNKYPGRACDPRPVNDQYKAKCIQNICQKQAISSANETANWKTYNNTAFSYGFKYPNDWILQAASQDKPGSIDQVFSYDQSKHVGGSSIFNKGETKIEIWRTLATQLNGKTLDYWVSNQGATILSKEIVKLDHQDWIKMTWKQDQPVIGYFIVNGNYILSINIYGDLQGNNGKLVDQIFSTFKFLDSWPTNCRPRPACLDATPRCLMPIIDDMCLPKN